MVGIEENKRTLVWFAVNNLLSTLGMEPWTTGSYVFLKAEDEGKYKGDIDFLVYVPPRVDPTVIENLGFKEGSHSHRGDDSVIAPDTLFQSHILGVKVDLMVYTDSMRYSKAKQASREFQKALKYHTIRREYMQLREQMNGADAYFTMLRNLGWKV